MGAIGMAWTFRCYVPSIGGCTALTSKTRMRAVRGVAPSILGYLMKAALVMGLPRLQAFAQQYRTF
jgi:hypothetical protein